MGRWLEYYGKRVRLDRVLDGPRHALFEDGDGVGVGWYSASGEAELANDPDLRELAGRVESHLFLVHRRADSGEPVQPFRHGRWLWIHDGSVDGWPTIRRDLLLAVDGRLQPATERSPAAEVLFLLALTFGLEQNPAGAVERMVGLVEDVGRRNGVEHPFRGPVVATDGERLWTFRYSSDGSPAPVHFTTRYETLKQLYPGDPRLDGFDAETRLVASEAFADLPGMWNDLPEACWGVVQPGQDEFGTFRPVAPVPA